MLKHLQQKILSISIPIENQWKVPWKNLGKQIVVIEYQPYLSISVSENLFYCFMVQIHYSVPDISKIDFMMFSASVHMTFKSAKIMLLLLFFNIHPPIKN